MAKARPLCKSWDVIPLYGLVVQIPNPLARYHQILVAVSDEPAGLSLGRLVHVVAMPRSTVHRIATSLCAVGYLRLTSEGIYVLGPALIELLRRSLTGSVLSVSLQPALQFLVKELGETAFFARLTARQVELVEAITPDAADRSYVHPGIGERPIDTCSSSKAILAFADQNVIRNMFEANGLATEDENDWLDFEASLHKVARDGYAVCDGEIDEGVFSVACPVSVGEMKGLFSIGVVGPCGRMKKTKLEKIVRLVNSAADLASTTLVDAIKRANSSGLTVGEKNIAHPGGITCR